MPNACHSLLAALECSSSNNLFRHPVRRRQPLGRSRFNGRWKPAAFFWSQRRQKQQPEKPLADSYDFSNSDTPRNLDVQLPLPVQYYQLLGLQGKTPVKSSDILGAYEDLCMSPIQQGYSRAVHQGKTVVLERARSLFVNAKDKMSAFASSVTVELALVPAVLAVLQEVGENELVVKIGRAVLAKLEVFTFQRDIKLAMALAQYTLAQEAFSSNTQTRSAYERLDEALDLLHQAGGDQASLSEDLEQRIIEGLQQLKPYCLLEVLQASSSKGSSKGSSAAGESSSSAEGGSSSGGTEKEEPAATPEQRSEAMLAIKELLLDTAVALDEEEVSPVNRDYVMSALQTMTAKEIVALLNWTLMARNPSQFTWCTSDILRVAALSHIVAGAAYHNAEALKAAQELLGSMQQECDVFVEQMVCELLMGRLGPAQKLLKSEENKRRKVAGYLPAASSRLALPPPTPRGSKSTKDAPAEFAPNVLPKRDDIIPFIRYHSPDEQGQAGSDSVLPGLCLFTELWLKQVALPQFPDTANPDTVDTITQRLRNLSTSSPEFVSQLSMWLTLPTTRLTSFMQWLWTRVTSALAPLLTGLGQQAGAARNGVATDLATFGASFRQSMMSVLGGVVLVLVLLYAGDVLESNTTPSSVAARSAASAASMTYYDASTHAHATAPPSSASNRPTATPTPLAMPAVRPQSTAVPQPVQQQQQAVQQKQQAVQQQQQAVQQQRQAVKQAVQPAAQSAQRQKTAMQQQVARLDVATAEKVVSSWQGAKAAALGPQHDVAALTTVVTDPLLSSVKQQSQQAADKGWFFDYSQQAVQVNSINTGAGKGVGEGEARVVAMVSERCDLKAVDGQKAGGYRDNYKVEYRLKKVEDGSWRICNVRLL